MPPNHQSRYKGYLLALLTATATFVAAIPFSAMPVLFKEISDDIGLSLVEIGTVWGISSLAGLFVSIAGGLLSDRFGVKAILGVFCILVGVTGAVRGLSDSFITLTLTVFLNGLVRQVVPVTLTKTTGLWFKGPKLGMAMGVTAMGFGGGLMLGPLISATWLSPWLGGWRNVMYFYGVVSAAVGILWLIYGKEPPRESAATAPREPLLRTLRRLVKIKALWLQGLLLLFRSGGIMGVTGYLPLYLRDRGWAPASADATLAAFYAVSTACVVPLSWLSDRLGSRKAIMFPAVLVAIVGIAVLPAVNGAWIWVLIIITGLFFDGFMALITVLTLETKEIGLNYSGTALGIIYTIAGLGGLFSPPVGNSLAEQNQALAFYFWAGLSAVALVILFFIKETGRRAQKYNGDLPGSNQPG